MDSQFDDRNDVEYESRENEDEISWGGIFGSAIFAKPRRTKGGEDTIVESEEDVESENQVVAEGSDEQGVTREKHNMQESIQSHEHNKVARLIHKDVWEQEDQPLLKAV